MLREIMAGHTSQPFRVMNNSMEPQSTRANISLLSSLQAKELPLSERVTPAAQILAEVSKLTHTIWIILKEPRFLPDHIDGRYLFDAATQIYEAQKKGKDYKPPSLGDIVMVDSVKAVRERKVLNSVRPFDHFTEDSIVWTDGRKEKIDAVIFCTGFKPAQQYLSSLNVINAQGKVGTVGTKSKNIEGLWLVGYGNWTGFASATLIGVGRSAKKTVEEFRHMFPWSFSIQNHDCSKALLVTTRRTICRQRKTLTGAIRHRRIWRTTKGGVVIGKAAC